MLQPTNLIVINPMQLQQGGTPAASKVNVCDQCGGLFIDQGMFFYGLSHSHAGGM